MVSIWRIRKPNVEESMSVTMDANFPGAADSNDQPRPCGIRIRPGLGHVLAWAFGLFLVILQTACLTYTPGSPNAAKSFVDGYPTFVPAMNGSADTHSDTLFNFVAEIPAGTNAKWEVDKATGTLHWEQKNGRPRVVQYLAYPGNYGMIPSTSLPYEVGGDGDPLDVLLLGPAVERGSVVPARPIGVLRLLDDGERDDKILAVQTQGPLSDVRDLVSLDANYAGALTIIETWFTNYKGPGRLISKGYGDAAEALSVVKQASGYFNSK
jgi:inorganic pyrophosphatase